MVHHLLNTETEMVFSRRSNEEIDRQAEIFRGNIQLQVFLSAVPDFVLILNQQRQTVAANHNVLSFLNMTFDEVKGKRPGEIFRCVNAKRSTFGCGASSFCALCGANKCLTVAGKEIANYQECRISSEFDFNALDLRVYATPLHVQGESFTIFTLTDISSEKRRMALEKIFFHDILNSAGALLGFMELTAQATPEEFQEYRTAMFDLAQNLTEEILAQRQLIAAENHEISVQPEPVHSITILQSLAGAYARHPVGVSKAITLSPDTEDFIFMTDEILLRRVIGNLIKNALEATSANTSVVVGARKTDAGVEFWVNNDSVMPENVQQQMFQRSFSTKGSGRGLGTYSVRILTERYLKGSVSFTSTCTDGTTFTISLPQSVLKSARECSASILDFSPTRA